MTATQSRTAGPAIQAERRGAVLHVAARGSWTVRDLTRIEAELTRLSHRSADARGASVLEIDLGRLEELDTAGAWRLLRLEKDFVAAGWQASFTGTSEANRLLLDVVRTNAATAWPARQRDNALLRFLADGIRTLAGAGGDAIRLTAFLGAITVAALRVLMRPWRFRFVSFVHHLEHAGLRAVPIIALICGLIGAVIMQQGVVLLRYWGLEPFSVEILGVLALREVGILLTAIMVAGRSAAAFTAEIGTMKMREEVDAMRTLGIDPMETLVLPRVAALVIALPLLVVIGDVACLAGGGLMALVYLDMTVPQFLERLGDVVTPSHFVVGLVKAPFAAVIIALVGCLEGLSVAGSAESLGRGVTSAVVKAIFLVIILDGVFAIFLSASGY